MSVKLSFMHYLKKTRVMLPVAFGIEEFGVVYIYIFFAISFFSLQLSVGKRSNLVKIDKFSPSKYYTCSCLKECFWSQRTLRKPQNTGRPILFFSQQINLKISRSSFLTKLQSSGNICRYPVNSSVWQSSQCCLLVTDNF